MKEEENLNAQEFREMVYNVTSPKLWGFYTSCILPDVPLTDEHTCVVDALGKAKLEDLGLQPPLQEILHFQAQNVIELHLALIQHSNTHQTPKQGIT